MKYWVTLGLLFCIGLLGTFFGYLYGYPSLVMRLTEKHLAQAAGGYNRTLHGKRPDAGTRGVVRPSPDQLYSLCVFNLNDGPVAFTGNIPDSYFSLSFYASNTNNFFVINNRQLTGDRYRFVLIGQNSEVPKGIARSHVIRAPSQKGIALTRLFIPSPRHVEKLMAIEKSSDCQSLSG